MTTLDLLFDVVALRRGDGKDEGERGGARAREERARGEGGMAERERQKGESSERGRKSRKVRTEIRFLCLFFSTPQKLLYFTAKNERSLSSGITDLRCSKKECCIGVAQMHWGGTGTFREGRGEIRKRKSC